MSVGSSAQGRGQSRYEVTGRRFGILADRSAERIREPMLGVYSNRSRAGEPRLPHEAEHERVDKIGRRGRTPTIAS